MNEVLFEASKLRTRFVGENGYGLAYGSHPCRTASSDSDLDLLYVSPAPLQTGQLQLLEEDVVMLHRRHGLQLDEEVAYTVKLHATIPEVRAALALRGFNIDRGGNLHVRLS